MLADLTSYARFLDRLERTAEVWRIAERTAIYELAAIMHHALTNVAPPHSSAYPPVRLLTPQVSPELENILSRALIEERTRRYQSYEEMKKDVQQML